jgi:hypothetical protein
MNCAHHVLRHFLCLASIEQMHQDNCSSLFSSDLGSFFMNGFLQVKVVMARKKYKIEYPNLYAPVGHKFQDEFNSVQRGM